MATHRAPWYASLFARDVRDDGNPIVGVLVGLAIEVCTAFLVWTVAA